MALYWFSADRILQTQSKPASIHNNTNLVRTSGWFGWGWGGFRDWLKVFGV